MELNSSYIQLSLFKEFYWFSSCSCWKRQNLSRPSVVCPFWSISTFSDNRFYSCSTFAVQFLSNSSVLFCQMPWWKTVKQRLDNFYWFFISDLINLFFHSLGEFWLSLFVNVPSCCLIFNVIVFFHLLGRYTIFQTVVSMFSCI